MEKRMLSKSQVNTFLQCPFKWKKQYIDKVKSKPSYAMLRGIKIHSSIENFYKHVEIKDNIITVKDKTIKVPKKFLEFEQRRLESCKKDGKIIDKYFKPLFQELRVSSKDLGLRGFIDAVYINPKDDELILVDYKSGKFRPDKYDDYRFELAIYKMLIESGDYIDKKVKYWCIFFVDQDKIFFEECREEDVVKAKKMVEESRVGMESGEYPAKLNEYCNWCDYKGECGI